MLIRQKNLVKAIRTLKKFEKEVESVTSFILLEAGDGSSGPSITAIDGAGSSSLNSLHIRSKY